TLLDAGAAFVDNPHPAPLAAVFFPARRIAELGARPPLGIAARQPARHEIVGARLHVEPLLGIHVVFHAARRYDGSSERAKAGKEGHTRSGTAASTTPMASEKRFQ